MTTTELESATSHQYDLLLEYLVRPTGRTEIRGRVDDRNRTAFLKLAAFALGLRHINPAPGYNGKLGLVICTEYGVPIRDWNPLLHATDALELGYKLGMTIDFCSYRVTAPVLDAEGCYVKSLVYDYKDERDFLEAILIVAAEIGRLK